MRILIAALCVLCLAPGSARAGSIVVGDFIGVDVGYFSPVTAGESRATALGSVPMSGGSGVSAAINGLSFEAYCIDILGPIFDPGTPQPGATFDATAASMINYTVYGGASPRAGAYVAWLYNQYASAIATADDNLARTGLQMAIWNTLYDSDFTVDGGAFKVSDQDTAVRAAANAYLSALSSNSTAASVADATWLQLQDCSSGTCKDVQDFVGPAAAATPVPEPGTFALMGIGVAGLALSRRRRPLALLTSES